MYVWSSASIVSGVPLLYKYLTQSPTSLCDLYFLEKKMLFWKFLTAFPVIITLLSSFWALFSVIRLSNNEMKTWGTIFSRTLLFIIVFLITWLPMTVVWVLDSFLTVPLIYWQVCWILPCCIGILNFSIWFIYFPDLRRNLSYVWRAQNTLDHSFSEPLFSGERKTFSSASFCTRTAEVRSTNLSVRSTSLSTPA